MGEVRALGGQLVQDGVRDQLNGQLDVAQRCPEPDVDQMQEHVERADVHARDLGPQRHVPPEARVVSDLAPTATHTGHTAYFSMREIRENVQEHLVRQLIDRLK